jgi:hypothetical protein
MKEPLLCRSSNKRKAEQRCGGLIKLSHGSIFAHQLINSTKRDTKMKTSEANSQKEALHEDGPFKKVILVIIYQRNTLYKNDSK